MSHVFEPGQYRARVTRWSLVKAKTGTPQFALTFMPLGKINVKSPDSELVPCPEVERTIFRSISSNTAEWVLQDLEQLFGYTDKRFTPLNPEHAEAFDFSHKEFTAVLTLEDRSNPETGEVTKVGVERWNFATAFAVGDPLSPSESRQLDALFGSAKPKRNGRKRAAEHAVETAPATTKAGTDQPV